MIRGCNSCLAKHDVHKLFIVKSVAAIGVINLEELPEVALVSEHSDLGDGLLEGGKVNLARVLEVKELERPKQESLLILQCRALLLKLGLQ